MSEQRPAKPDGRVTDTRQRIVREAERLYYQGGYAGLNLQTLAASLKISKPALFHHFKTKQDLFFATLLEMLESRRVLIETAVRAGETTPARLRNILRAMLDCPFFDPMKFLTDEKGSLSQEQQRDIEAAFYRSIQRPIAQVLAEGVERGELRMHHPMLSAMVFLNLLMLLPSPGHPNTRLGQQLEPQQYIDDLLAIFLQGVGVSQQAD